MSIATLTMCTCTEMQHDPLLPQGFQWSVKIELIRLAMHAKGATVALSIFTKA